MKTIRHCFPIFLFLVIGTSFSAHSQTDSVLTDTAVRTVQPPNPVVPPQPATDGAPRLKYNPGQFFTEMGAYFTSPFRWKGEDWLKFTGVVAITAASTLVDEPIQDNFRRNDRFHHNVGMRMANEWGGFYFAPVLSLGLYAHGWLAKNHKTKKLGFEIAQAAAYSEILNFAAKNIIGRSRPFLNQGAYEFRVPSLGNSPHNSMPAGHMNCAMAISTVLARNTQHKGLKVLAYLPAAACGIERVLSDDHWFSDVVIGGFLGFATGHWVVNLHERKEAKLQVSSLYPFSVRYAIK